MKGKGVPLFFIFFCVFAMLLLSGLWATPSWAALGQQEQLFPRSPATADHKKFKELDQNFSSAPEVTSKACLKCHNLAGQQLEKSLHWTWRYEAEDGRILGKANVLNNF